MLLFYIPGTVIWLDMRLTKTMYYLTREWPYKNVKLCIIAEAYMEDGLNSTLLMKAI